MTERIDILMPLEQEGSKSVVRTWLKAIGDSVRRDEPIVELETDKVAVEIPSPGDGVLSAISIAEGEDAAPGAVLGVLTQGTLSADQAPIAARAIATAAKTPETPARRERDRETRLSPLVKRLLADHGIDPTKVNGTGRDGRITHKDVETYVHNLAKATNRSKASVASQGTRQVPHDSMRRAIAEHMSRSVAIAPHVTAVFEADFTSIAAHRERYKADYAQAGIHLTYSAYIVCAAAEAMKAAPNVNARWSESHLDVFEDVNIGFGVALGDKGLIVPVIRQAQTLSLKEVAARLTDLTDRARKDRLQPVDVQGGTFTISNHGVSGSLLAAPIIINQPQSAILGIGKLEKRVVVREINGADAILVRPMAYVSLTIDHRVLDGHQTNAWLTRFVEILENWPLDDE